MSLSNDLPRLPLELIAMVGDGFCDMKTIVRLSRTAHAIRRCLMPSLLRREFEDDRWHAALTLFLNRASESSTRTAPISSADRIDAARAAVAREAFDDLAFRKRLLTSEEPVHSLTHFLLQAIRECDPSSRISQADIDEFINAPVTDLNVEVAFALSNRVLFTANRMLTEANKRLVDQISRQVGLARWGASRVLTRAGESFELYDDDFLTISNLRNEMCMSRDPTWGRRQTSLHPSVRAMALSAQSISSFETSERDLVIAARTGNLLPAALHILSLFQADDNVSVLRFPAALSDNDHRVLRMASERGVLFHRVLSDQDLHGEDEDVEEGEMFNQRHVLYMSKTPWPPF